MNDPKAKALKKKMDERFEKNSFAKSYKERNEKRHVTREMDSAIKRIPKALRRDSMQ